MSGAREWIVTAVYADVIDEPQVYDTTVEAETEEDAEQIARRAAVEDNGGTWPDDKGSYELTDLYVRLAPNGNRDSIALDRIATLLSGTEWSADTAPTVAEIVRATGRTIADLDECPTCAGSIASGAGMKLCANSVCGQNATRLVCMPSTAMARRGSLDVYCQSHANEIVGSMSGIDVTEGAPRWLLDLGCPCDEKDG